MDPIARLYLVGACPSVGLRLYYRRGVEWDRRDEKGGMGLSLCYYRRGEVPLQGPGVTLPLCADVSEMNALRSAPRPIIRDGVGGP